MDDNLEPKERDERGGDFCNTQVQPLRTAIFLDCLAKLDSEKGYPLGKSDHFWNDLVRSATLLKILKPLEILDRRALGRGYLTTDPDDRERLRKHAGSLAPKLGGRPAGEIFEIASHTVGTGGFTKFLSVHPDGTLVIGGSWRNRLLRAADDCTLSLTGTSGDLYGLSIPEDKPIVLAKTRGDGLLGALFVGDQDGKINRIFSRDIEDPAQVKGVIGTMGQVQALLSRSILEVVSYTIFGDLGGEDPVQHLIDSANSKLKTKPS
ncbi:MAG: hypothetical protein KDD42_01275 [Bdellovibrionales bacterium]|nr:hypothetical protein [Bdellovibrionales bacterium]